MKKLYSLLVAAAIGAASAHAGIEMTFDGTTTLPDGWKTGAGSYEIANGHYTATTALQSNNTYRADLKFDSSNTLTLDPAKDKYLAVKFIGNCPTKAGSLKCEFNDGTGWFNQNHTMKGSFTTPNKNTVCYFILSEIKRNITGTEPFGSLTDPYSAKLLNIIIADIPQENGEHYTIDWIKTFETMDELETSTIWNDDTNDTDEPADATFNFYNETTGKYHASFEAWFEAMNGMENHTLTLHGDFTTSNRHIFDTTRKNMTLQGAEGKNVTVTRGTFNSNITMFEAKQTTITLQNMTLQGNENEHGSDIMSSGTSGHLKLNNVTVQGFKCNTETKNVVTIKANCAATLNGVKFVNNSAQCDVFVFGDVAKGTLNIDSECKIGSIMMQEKAVINYSEAGAAPAAYILADETTATPTKLTLLSSDATKNAGSVYNIGDVVVNGCSDPSKFDLYCTSPDGTSEKYYDLAAQDGNLVLTSNTGIDNVAADRTEGTVNVYTLQGVLVRQGVSRANATQDLPAGLYIAGGKKILVK